MKKKLFLSFFIFLISYFSIFYFIGKGNLAFVDIILSSEQKNFIKKIIFPYKVISQQETRISALSSRLSMHRLISNELSFKNRKQDIVVEKIENIANGQVVYFDSWNIIE